MSQPHSRPDYHPAHWQFVAKACAEQVYAKRDASQRGILLVEDEGVLVFYDTRLVRDSMRARERVAEKFRHHLADRGLPVLATATYPQRGPDDGRALAVVLSAGAGDEDDVAEEWERAYREVPPEYRG